MIKTTLTTLLTTLKSQVLPILTSMFSLVKILVSDRSSLTYLMSYLASILWKVGGRKAMEMVRVDPHHW